MRPSPRIVIVTGAVAWFVAAAAANPAPARASSLDGFVRSKDAGESISYARISLTLADSAAAAAATGAPIGTLSNQAGYYSFRSVAEGTYLLRVKAFGYRDRAETVTLGAVPTRLDLELEPAPFQIAPVEVAGERGKPKEAERLPGFVELSAKQLQRLPAVGEQDLIRSLQLLPGVQSASDLSSGLYIRGGGPDQTLILLDQIPLYNPTHAFGFFSTFNPTAIKDVALYKGAYPSQYGGRLGSVLDVTNRDGNRESFHGTGGVSLIAGRFTAEGPIEKGSWILSARRTYLDPLLDAIRDDSTEIPSYYFYDLNGRVNRALGPGDNVSLSGYRGRDVLRLDLDRGSYIDIRWGNAAGTAKWTHVFGPGVFGNFLVAASEYVSDTEVQIFSTPITFSNRLLDLSGKADIDWRPAPTHEVNAGISAAFYKFTLTQAFNQVPQPGFDERPAAYTLYVEDQWTPSLFWAFRPGLRAEVFGEKGRLSLEPRLSVSHIVTPEVRVKAGGGAYTQHLQLVSTEGFSGADFWVPTDASAQAGRSWQAVGGVEYEPSQRYMLAVEGYYTSLRNLVQIDDIRAPDAEGTTTEDIFFTGGSGWASGIEVFAQRRTGPVTGWIGYTIGWSRRRWDEVNQGFRFPPKYDRRHDLKLVAEWKRGKWSYGANFLFATGQAFTPVAARYELTNPATGQPEDGLLLPGPKNSARLLPYHRLDVSVTRHGRLFGARADYFLQIFNLYNRKNEWFVQYDTDGRETEPEIVHQLPIVPTIGVNFEF